MIENPNTIRVSPPLDAEDWQIAFEPYLKHPFLALALAQHLTALQDYVQSDAVKATAAINRAVDALYEHSEFRSVTAVQVSDGYAHDYPYFKPLVEQTAKIGFKMQEVSADKGYLGATNMLATLQRGAIPYIPFKSNSVPDSRGSYGAKSELWTRMYHFYSLHRTEFLQHYHKRSNVETTFHMIKSKFGQRLRSKSLTAQINEALCKVLCHNLCVVIQSVHELGIEAAFATESAA